LNRRYEAITMEETEGRSLLKPLLLTVSLAIFIAGGFYFGSWALAYNIVGIEKLPLLSLPLQLKPANNENDGTQAVDYSNKERVNILILGIDKRPDELENRDPIRTDTMMVLTIDPKSKTAAMLSLPRDLWVPIPVKDGTVVHDRINAAHVFGDLYKYPGGGPALAVRTVEYNLGVKIHHFVKIDFEGFSRMIDALGGVTVELDQPLIDNQYPTPDYGIMRINIPAGVQHLDGEKALWLARSRHMDSDFGRIKRQQQLMMAVREKVLQINVLPKLPKLWSEFRNAVDTDMNLPQIIGLAMVAKDIKRDSIASYSIDGSTVRPVRTIDGADILVPVRSEIKKLMDQYLSDSPLSRERPKVLILNGTSRIGLASRTAQRLKDLGFTDIEVGDSEVDGSSSTTKIYDLSGKKYSLNLLAEALKIPPSRITKLEASGNYSEDIRIVLGEDAPFN